MLTEGYPICAYEFYRGKLAGSLACTSYSLASAFGLVGFFLETPK